MITYIDTYHWNSGQGTSSGGTISLKKDDGKIFGPWTVTAESGSGVANVWWISHPNVVIPAGTYTIIDSEPETWSRNSESNGCGFSKVEGHPEKGLSGQEITPGSTKKPETQTTAPPNGGSFKITNIEYPNEVKANGARGDLTVYWSGDPVFPVKMIYRPRSCLPGVTCTTPTMTFDVRQNPLVFPESVWCTGSGGIYFDYEVVVIDARGIESAPFHAPFTCTDSTDLSRQEITPGSITKETESPITNEGSSNGVSTKTSTTSKSGLKDSLIGDWVMQGKQTGVKDSDFKATLILNSDGSLKWLETEGANVGATRSGTWGSSGSTITMKWSSPKGGQITWVSSSVTKDDISDGTYTAELVSGGTWAASRSIQSGTEKEVALSTDEKLGNYKPIEPPKESNSKYLTDDELKTLYNFGKELQNRAPPEVRTDLDKAKYAYTQYCNVLAKGGAPVNADYWTRFQNVVRNQDPGRWTCGFHEDSLTQIFMGMGLGEKIVELEAQRESSLPEDVAKMKDPNFNHIAIAIKAEGDIFVFDPWQQALNSKNGDYNGAENSMWNGMTAGEWDKILREKQQYVRFTDNGGIEWYDSTAPIVDKYYPNSKKPCDPNDPITKLTGGC